MIWFYARLLLWQHALKLAARLARWTVTAAVLVTAAPVTVVTIAAVTVAWLRGWPPARLRRAAAWSLPMTATWLAVQAVTTRSLPAVLAAPYLGWRAGWHAFSLGNTAAGVRAVRAGRGPGRAADRLVGVGDADLPDRDRPGRAMPRRRR